MSSLAAIFLLIAAASIYQIYHTQRVAAETVKTKVATAKDELFKRILNELRLKPDDALQGIVSNNCSIVSNKDPFKLKIIFLETQGECGSLNFETGSYTLGEPGQAFLKTTVKNIFTHICDGFATTQHQPGSVEGVTLLGHTDNIPMKKCIGRNCLPFEGCQTSTAGEAKAATGFCNNVQLSARRAQYVFFNVRAALPQGDATAACVDKLFTVAGQGPMHPLSESNLGSSMPQAGLNKPGSLDRRVELTIEFKQPASFANSI